VPAILVFLILALGGCASLPKPDGPHGPSLRDGALLDPTPPGLLIELDRVEGAAPRPQALARFLRQTARTVDKPAGIELVVDGVLPRGDYEAKGSRIRSLAARNRSLGTPDNQQVVHLLYAPEFGKYRGYAWRRDAMDRYGRRYRAPLVVIFTDQLKPIAWISGVIQEASVLIHEMGHAYGLATDPGHSHAGHCTNGWCSLYDGVDARSAFYWFFPALFAGQLPLGYCRDCRDDLEGSRR
jgi:hypothetical protein